MTESTVTIGKNTGITLGLVILAFGGVSGGMYWFGQWTTRIEAWMAAVDMRMESIERALLNTESNHITRTEMSVWIHRLEELNPDVAVPGLE